ncbi:hypothetical protein DFH08DRAFT_742347 [Mycena albidolilacea]|uniref:NACHT domain-containing protein n=1 Tax=Mycena albidolilacea TaxID=1033008 RepID=A0AAD7A5C6_9AGAR|nr:hypothetical protein DFH08DRAFT_742347 [Mycena albidolilacea]
MDTSSRPHSTFQRALGRYIASLPEKKTKRKFIVACCAATVPITPESINEAIKQAEQKRSDRPGMKMARKILSPVIEVLKDYYAIIDTLAGADPMPTALIWGALKIVIDGGHRFFDLFETIKKELRSLKVQLERINDYDYLYGDSEHLQELLCETYINMLRFWSRVDKECDTCWFTGMLKSVRTFSTEKLNKIIKNLEEDVDQIEKLASILEANKNKNERQAAEVERFQAGIERTSARKERAAQSAWREQNERDRQEERYHKICGWLCARQGNGDNMSHLRVHNSLHLHGTCEWLFQHSTYVDWRDGAMNLPILWVHGPPGSGKSILSTRVIHVLSEAPASNAHVVAYHFYRFDQMHTASETLRLLASQLFDAHWNHVHVVPENICSNSKTQQNVCSLENVQELITQLVQCLPRTYFILDGLDEECNGRSQWHDAVGTLNFLVKLASDMPDRVRVWYSSQPRTCINDKLKAYHVLDIQDAVKNDVALYLSRLNPDLGDLEVSERDKDDVLTSLRSRAEANFLWASLMLRTLKESASLTEMRQFVAEGLPETLDDYYRRIFDRFDKRHRSLVSKVFALVAFARRPLRMAELREAVGLLLSKNPRSLNAPDMPFSSHLRTLFPPLIELQQDGCSDTDEYTCRLFHSTVRDFLVKNCEVLQSGFTGGPKGDVLITPDVIGNACLLYLCQERYARLLRKRHGRWIDSVGESVDRHQFHLYAAKYWDKHLDDSSPSEALHNRICSFITSTNFQTCMQVQSLWVESQFGVFSYAKDDGQRYLRRMFPAWFVKGTEAGTKLWLDFREFLHEWKHFLHCPRIVNSKSITLPYIGELDRCWWPTLGPNNFLSKLRCKYPAFAIQRSEDSLAKGGHYAEGLSADGKEFVTTVLSTRTDASLVFTCEQWSCRGSYPPTLQKTQEIVTTDKATNWREYVKRPVAQISKERIGRAHPIAFSPSLDFLRIGTQLFARNDGGDYIGIPGLNAACEYHPACVEEFAIRGNFIALASRHPAGLVKTYSSGLPDENIDYIGPDLLRIEGESRLSFMHSRSQSSDSVDSSSTDSEDGGYETWSEGTTEFSEDVEDDIITPWAGPVSDMDDRETDSGSEADSADSSDQSSSESDSDDSHVDPSTVVGYGRWHDDNNDHIWGDSDDDSDNGGFYGPPPPRRNRTQEPIANISIFDSSSRDPPNRVFHFTKPLPFPLRDSPPAIHPSKSLVVWPLSAGDVLFADFIAKTYFVRKLRPSTSHTRHIFMKSHFSPCGSYVHFASLEGQKKPVSGRRKKSKSEEPPVKLALLVATYRLSARKTCRSPPTLIHRVRINLGSRSMLSVSNSPYTLTWTPTELYFTCSDEILQVKRISLFDIGKLATAREHLVLMPRKPVFLPESAGRRKVYFFPPLGDRTAAMVVLGSETRGAATRLISVDDQLSGGRRDVSMYEIKYTLGLRSPPLGCYLREETDFGGWTKCYDLSKLPEDLGIAQLDRRIEKFDPEDDCDLEPYVF